MQLQEDEMKKGASSWEGEQVVRDGGGAPPDVCARVAPPSSRRINRIHEGM